jgi:hypothetical protein
MPLDYEESLEDLQKYDKYFISAHGKITPNNFPSFWETWLKWRSSNNKLFLKVPKNVYIVNLINIQETEELYNDLESEFIKNCQNDNYIEKILLTPNEEIEDQFMKNKIVYAPGSCVIDTTLNFETTFVMGIFKIPDELDKYETLRDSYDNRRIDRYNNYIDPEPIDNCKFKDIVNKSRFESKDYLLSEIVEKINKDGKKKIIIVSSCNPIEFDEKLFNEKLLNDIFKNSGRDLRTIDKKRMEIEFIVALEECNNDCILYSKEYFSVKYSSNPYSYFNTYKNVNKKHFTKTRRRQEAESDIIRYGNDYKIPVNPSRASKMKLRSYIKVSNDNIFKPVLSVSEEIEDGTSDRYYKYPEIKDYICKLSDDILNQTSLRKQKISKLKSRKRKRSYDGKRKSSKKRK